MAIAAFRPRELVALTRELLEVPAELVETRSPRCEIGEADDALRHLDRRSTEFRLYRPAISRCDGL
jgi:hypothetical protein